MSEALGRPRVELTPEQVAQVEKLAAVLTQAQIADVLGIADRTLRSRIADDPAVSAAYKRGRANAVSGVATSLLKKARDGNVVAMIFYLKTQAGWSEDAMPNAEVRKKLEQTLNEIESQVDPDTAMRIRQELRGIWAG